MKKHFLYIGLLILLFSCEERTDWNLDVDPGPIIVIDGMITNERKSHEVKIETSVQNINETPLPITGALVAITDQDDIFILTEDGNVPGLYKTDPDIQAVFGKVYTLYIRYGNEEYIGSTYMVPVEPLNPHQIVPCDEKEDYYHIIGSDLGSPFMLQTDLSWVINDETYDITVMYYHLNSIDVNEYFKPEKETVCFPAGTSIKRKKFSLSDEQQSFIRSKLMETEWRGGLFDVEQGNIRTNMSNGAIGFFASYTVVMDSIFFDP